MASSAWLYSAIRLSRHSAINRIFIWFAEVAAFAACILFAFLLRFEFLIPQLYYWHLLWAFATWVPVKLVIFRAINLDRGWWRFVSVHDLVRLGLGNLVASLCCVLLTATIAPAGFPRSLYLLDFLLCLLATASQRLLVRMIVDVLERGADFSVGTRIFIYGAGVAGIALLREIHSNPKLHYAVCGFIDDDSRKRGVTFQGMRVLGGGQDLRRLASRHKVTEILIALPSATGAEMVAVLNRCHAAALKCRTIPALGEMIETICLSKQLRDVAVEDLLGRKPIRLEEEQIHTSLAGRMVLVTGAAGSIGSELCRQIARFCPAGIIGFDIAESPLFEIDREMRMLAPKVPFYPQIGSIQNRTRLREVLRQFSPSIVYHAAAYKHVPLMETHAFEAVENNVFGTYNLATEAAESGVEEFVMISSDKAVRPTNVMGATKRVNELLLLGLQNGGTKFVSVRFGNVLGSSGSVIPIFKRQIANGGPVTVTHPEMRRFFMTIPEACQLVLQAGVVAEGGQICVLDMGSPVKIVDLAKNLILLSGLRVEEDIKIKFTGMRPGEKLYEELHSMLEDTVPTAHEKIRIFVGGGIPEGDNASWLQQLRKACDARDQGRLIVALKSIVLDYSPSVYVLERLVEGRKEKQIALSA